MKIRSEFQKPLQNDLRSVFVIEKSCNVIELASELLKPCEGAFIYKNETYYGCTQIGDSNGRAWCSTKIDPLTYEHVSGGNFYGFCPEDGSCSTAEEGQKIQDRAIDLESCKIIFYCFWFALFSRGPSRPTRLLSRPSFQAPFEAHFQTPFQVPFQTNFQIILQTTFQTTLRKSSRPLSRPPSRPPIQTNYQINFQTTFHLPFHLPDHLPARSPLQLS